MIIKRHTICICGLCIPVNAILVWPMTNKEAGTYVETNMKIYEYLKQRGFKPTLNVLDNECSKTLKEWILSDQMTIQFVEPENHRVNAAETAIKATKYHILAGLQTVDKDRPLQLWSKFTEQMQDTLNLLRTARQDPTKSAYKFLQGEFDYNKTPMAILGTRAVAFTDPDKRGAWEAHGIDAYVVGRWPLHY